MTFPSTSLTILLLLSSLHSHIANASSFSKRALSPTVQIPSPEYVRLLNHSVLFYEAQRSGKLPADNRVPWRHDSALTDGSDSSIDLTGGYYDAGNYLKFTFPLSYTTFMLSWGGTDYIEGYQMANQTEYLRDQIKWATDWLIKAHPQSSTLFVQVGDLAIDNNYFGPDSGIPLPRPCLQINETNFGTDAASMAATAFASAATFFNNLAQSNAGTQDDSKYAEILLLHATQLYNASYSILPYVRYQSSIPSIQNAYGSTDYMDDLILSGIALYRATQNQTYLNQALELYRSTAGNNNHTEPLDWDNKWGALYVLLAELMSNNPNNISEALQARIDAENYLDGIVSGLYANKTSGGLLFWDFYSNDNSNQNAMSTSHLLLSYSTNVLRPLAENSNDKEALLAKVKRYEDLANSQLDYVFGKNPLNQNYIVGERSNSPQYPHSASASGSLSLKEAIDNPKDLLHAHTIYGALVGGAAKNDSFADVRLDWSQTEVALDYNAPYQNLLAYQIMFNPNNPFYGPETTSNNSDGIEKNGDNHTSFPRWGIALAVVLPILFIMALLALLFIFIRCLRNTDSKKHFSVNEPYLGNNEEEKAVQVLGIDHSAISGSTSTFVNKENYKEFGIQQHTSTSADTLAKKLDDVVIKEENDNL